MTMKELLESIKPKITLSIRGASNTDGSFDWENALVDAAILTAITIGTGLGVAGSDGVFTQPECISLFSAAIIEFFGFIAAKRKLQKK